METRKITIADTKTQKRYTLNTNATTLGELMDEMTSMGINYFGMSFNEGLSKTELLSRDTQLPTNVMYKGTPTNDLVILLTNNKKNISSGTTTRQELYAYIKMHNLQSALKTKYGKNFTILSSAILDLEVERHKAPNTCNCSPSEAKGDKEIESSNTTTSNAKETTKNDIEVPEEAQIDVNTAFNAVIQSVLTLGSLIHALTIEDLKGFKSLVETITTDKKSKKATTEDSDKSAKVAATALSDDDISNIIADFF